MKKLVLLLVASVIALQGEAQTKLTPAQQATVVEQINKATTSMKSMQCSFVQEKSMKMLSKKMISSGVMYYKRTNKLRWQYNKPYSYTFLLNGDNVKIRSSKSEKNVNVKDNKMFRQISKLIISTMTGGSLKGSADFNVQVYRDGKAYLAKLYPKKKELKQLYKCIELSFNPSLTMISSVKMEEKTGDITVVKLNDVKTNLNLNESLFALN